MISTPRSRPSPLRVGARGSPHSRLTTHVPRRRRGSTVVGLLRSLYTLAMFACVVVVGLHLLAARYPQVGSALAQFDTVVHFIQHPRDYISQVLGPLQNLGN